MPPFASNPIITSGPDLWGHVRPPYIAQDVVGVGPEELVIVVEGSSARVAAWDTNKPVDAVIIGILDSLQFNGETTFKKH